MYASKEEGPDVQNDIVNIGNSVGFGVAILFSRKTNSNEHHGSEERSLIFDFFSSFSLEPKLFQERSVKMILKDKKKKTPKV